MRASRKQSAFQSLILSETQEMQILSRLTELNSIITMMVSLKQKILLGGWLTMQEK